MTAILCVLALYAVIGLGVWLEVRHSPEREDW